MRGRLVDQVTSHMRAPAAFALAGLPLLLALSACSSNAPAEVTGGTTGTQALDGLRDLPDGVTPDDSSFRALMVLNLTNESGLRALVDGMYTPGSATFRQYLSVASFEETYAPSQANLAAVTAWVTSAGMAVNRTSANRMLVEFSGTVSAFQTAFGVTLTETTRSGANIYTVSGTLTLPAALAGKVSTVLTPDLPATPGTLSDTGTVTTKLPGTNAFLSKDLTIAYGASTLAAHGAGEAIGVVAAGGVRVSDVQSYWQSQSLTRNDPVFVVTQESPSAYNTEATLDTEWSGGMAPDAEVRVYQAPDIRDTSLVYAFHEAIGGGQVTVVTDSFAHNESVEPVDVRTTYNYAALEAAALGITVLSSSGDSNLVDVPASCPYVTAVGGTSLVVDDDAWASETVWAGTGCGASSYFAQPSWQTNMTPGNTTRRATADIASEADALWIFQNGGWQEAGGTSFASPTAAGLIATLNSARRAAGSTRVGFLNPILYGSAATQAALHDITSGAAMSYSASAGWDYPTGWGSINVAKLVTAIP
jgi:kumamolisin